MMDQSTTTKPKRPTKKVPLPVKFDYVIQPNRWTNARYETSVIGEKLLNSIIFNLQDAITLSFKNEDYTQLTLWQDCNSNTEINLKIPLNEITIPQHYNRVKEVLKGLASCVVEIPYLKENNQEHIQISSLLWAELPKVPNYSSVIDIFIKRNVAKWLIHIDKDSQGKPIQWTRYMYQVAQSAKNKYTSKIYKKLCSWRQKGGFVISEKEFREWLVIENKYKDMYDVKKNILIPVQDELKNMGDLWFNCRADDFFSKVGDKNMLHFKIISPKTEEYEAKQKDNVYHLLRTYFKFEDRHIELIQPIFAEANPSSIYQKVSDLYTYYKDNKHKVSDLTSYTVKSLLNEFCSSKLF